MLARTVRQEKPVNQIKIREEATVSLSEDNTSVCLTESTDYTRKFLDPINAFSTDERYKMNM